MKRIKKKSSLVIVLHVLLSVIAMACGIYVLLEKNMIIAGKYSGHFYKLETSSSILISLSFFLVSVFLVLVLSDKSKVKKVNEWLLGAAIFLFILSAFI